MDFIAEAKRIIDDVENAENPGVDAMRLYIEASYRRMILNTIIMLNNNAPVSKDVVVLSNYHQFVSRTIYLAKLQFNTEPVKNGEPTPEEQNRKKNIVAGQETMGRILQQFEYFSNIEIRDENSYRGKLRQLLGNVWTGFIAYRNAILKLEKEGELSA